jgi:hypothetical protein
MQRYGIAFAVLLAVAIFLLPRDVRADQPGAHTVNVAVLGLDSEEAEDNAIALTNALRSRLIAADGWSLIESTQSLGMLTAALRCPPRPPVDCQQKIADQLKVDRYIWGFVLKGPQQGQVTAEVHLYQKNKPDTMVRESYADNLKDGQDDKGLGKIAQRILDRLGGSAMGTVVVKAGDLTGEVIVDGTKRIPLTSGTARFELGASGHSIEISAPGRPTTKRNVVVAAGRETVIDVSDQTATTPPGEGAEPGKPFPVRKVLAGAAALAGVALGVVSVIEYGKYNDAVDAGDRDKASVPEGVKPCEREVEFQQFCNDDKNAKKHSTVAWITAGGGLVLIGTGVVLWLTDSSSSDRSTTTGVAKPPKPKTRLAPTFGAGSGGLMLTGTF